MIPPPRSFLPPVKLPPRFGGGHVSCPSRCRRCQCKTTPRSMVLLPAVRNSRTVVTVLLLSLLVPFTVVTVNGWGKQGHEMIGNIASALLSQQVNDQIAILLNLSSSSSSSSSFSALTKTMDTSRRPERMSMTVPNRRNDTTTNNSNNVNAMKFQLYTDDCMEYCTPLARIADWADQIRFHTPWSAALHYIDIRDDLIVATSSSGGGCPVVDDVDNNHTNHRRDDCYFNYTRDCPNDRCVAGAIMNYTKQLLLLPPPPTYQVDDDDSDDRNDSIVNNNPLLWNRRESLMFLVHFLGDIHQPLHCSRTTDRGGNTIHVHYSLHPSRSSNSTTNTTTTARNYHPLSQPTSSDVVRHNREYIDHSSSYLRDHHRSQSHERMATTSSSHYSHHGGLNLHAVWDDRIIETILQREFQNSRNALEDSLVLYIDDIRTNHPSIFYNKWLHCMDVVMNNDCVTQWGNESFHLAMQYAYANVDGSEIVDDTTLEESYYESRNPIVRQQLAIASVRLATILEQIFSSSALGI